MKKIAVNTIKSFLKEHKRDDTFEDAGNTFDVVFHTSLSIAEKTIFINRVLSGCFDGEGNFRPEYVSPMLRATILQMCTNVPALTVKNDTGDGNLPVLDLESMDELYQTMDLDHVDNPEYQVMLDEMTSLCSQAIDWKKSRGLSNNKVDFALKNLMDTLAAKIDSVDTGALMQYANSISDAMNGFADGVDSGKLIDLVLCRDKTNE